MADAQLLLESIDVRLLPNPMLHGELLDCTREILLGIGSLCIRLQCAGNPEYSVPAEFDCAHPNEGGFPSTKFAADEYLQRITTTKTRRWPWKTSQINNC
ncbi:hypothetical protein ANAPH2_00723 [Anaplasma phagocytophilum]|nr:hypothetical protein ANAPH2_00723 [Anaplasma phagocytophilum]